MFLGIHMLSSQNTFFVKLFLINDLCYNESLQFGGKYMQCILVCFLKSLLLIKGQFPIQSAQILTACG